MVKEEPRQLQPEAGKPQEGQSAKLSTDGTYKEEIHKL